MVDEQGGPRRRGGIADGIRSGIGVLNAFREAVEETVQEAVERGDLKPERARHAVQDAMRRAQDTLEDVRERVDVVPRREFDRLREEVAELRQRVERMEGGADPDDLPGSGIIIEAE